MQHFTLSSAFKLCQKKNNVMAEEINRFCLKQSQGMLQHLIWSLVILGTGLCYNKPVLKIMFFAIGPLEP